ncbi:Zinc finger CCCH domain-containing protein 5 [Linum perenne]
MSNPQLCNPRLASSRWFHGRSEGVVVGVEVVGELDGVRENGGDSAIDFRRWMDQICESSVQIYDEPRRCGHEDAPAMIIKIQWDNREGLSEQLEVGEKGEKSSIMPVNRKEKRKSLKKLKRKQARKEIAEREREDEERRANDPEEQNRLNEMEEAERLKMERDRKEFEERERKLLEEMERQRQAEEEEAEKRIAQVEEEEEANRRLQALFSTFPFYDAPKNEGGDEDSNWEYVEEGPPEIIWQGNEIIVRKKKVRVPKKHVEVHSKEDATRPTSNPLPPESEASSISAQEMLKNVAQDVPNFGTEQDKAHCPFHLKTGACRFGQRCSRVHFYPDKACTLLIKNMYNGPGLAWEQDEGLEVC